MEERDELAELLTREVKGAEPTQAGGWYSREGDCVFFYGEDVPHHAERVDALLTSVLTGPAGNREFFLVLTRQD